MKTTLQFKIRFSEIDAMNVVWHGVYAKYMEDAREHFGKVFGLSYELIRDNGYFAPIVEMSIHYKKPLFYGMEPAITISYRKTEAAKIIFDYEIRDSRDQNLVATAQTVQVFMDRNYELVWESPTFYEDWKRTHTSEQKE